MVAFETIGTLHQCVHLGLEEVSDDTALSTFLQWEVIGYGIPVVVANTNGVALCLADVDTGDMLCSFTISPVSQYTVINDDFHIFAKPSGCFGIGLANSTVANRIFAVLKSTVDCASISSMEEEATEEDEGIEPPPKQRRLIPDDDRDEVDVAEDQVDMGHKKEKKKLEISEPKNFEHLSHIGEGSSVIQFNHVLAWTETLKRREHIVGQVISIPPVTVRSKEEDEIPPTSTAAPPLPPPLPTVRPPPAKVELKKRDVSMPFDGRGQDLAASLAEEIKKGVVLRPVNYDNSSCSSESSGKSFSSLQEELKGGVVLKTVSSHHTMTLPMPRRTRESEKLLFEIKTFRRKKLRDISVTDSPPSATARSDESSLEEVLKKGLASIFKRISDSTEISNVGSVNSKGEDTFDGLFNET